MVEFFVLFFFWLVRGFCLLFSIKVFSDFSWDICKTIQMMLQVSVFKTPCLLSSHLNIPKLCQLNILELLKVYLKMKMKSCCYEKGINEGSV